MQHKKINPRQFRKLFAGKNVNQVVQKLCGEMIGTGLYRDVYVLKCNTDYVVKIERDQGTNPIFANVTEWCNFVNNKEWDFLKDWLAPCELISTSGQIMIQRRVSWEGKKRKDYPTHIPVMFTDTKLRNFGWIGDKFVCCDYSYMPVAVVKEGDKMMKKTKWWGTFKA